MPKKILSTEVPIIKKLFIFNLYLLYPKNKRPAIPATCIITCMSGGHAMVWVGCSTPPPTSLRCSASGWSRPPATCSTPSSTHHFGEAAGVDRPVASGSVAICANRPRHCTRVAPTTRPTDVRRRHNVTKWYSKLVLAVAQQAKKRCHQVVLR